MGGGGSTLSTIASGDFGAITGDVESIFKEDEEANILTGGAVGFSRQAIRDFGLDPEEVEDPALPEEADVLTEEEIAEQSELAREFELIRSQGFQGRGSTIKSGSTGTASNIQTTFKQLSGR